MERGKKYLLVFSVDSRSLTFTGEILDIDTNFVTFKDKFNKILSYNIDYLISYEEVNE